jgi:hypothetical protein
MAGHRQTTRIAGQRVILTTSSTGKVTVKPAPPTEDQLQAAQVRAMRRHPANGKLFTFAADMNSEKRGPKARAKALATGMMAGEPDLRLSFAGGRLVYVENKVGRGRMQASQEPRHELLRKLGFVVHVLRAESEEDAVAQLMAIVEAELEKCAAGC